MTALDFCYWLKGYLDARGFECDEPWETINKMLGEVHVKLKSDQVD